MIFEQSNFVSAQTAQWDLYLQCSFRDKLELKEEVFFYFWKPGLAHPTSVLTCQKSKDSIPGLDLYLRIVAPPNLFIEFVHEVRSTTRLLTEITQKIFQDLKGVRLNGGV